MPFQPLLACAAAACLMVASAGALPVAGWSGAAAAAPAPIFDLDALRSRYADLEREIAGYRATLGPRHPVLAAAEQALADLRGEIAAAHSHALRSVAPPDVSADVDVRPLLRRFRDDTDDRAAAAPPAAATAPPTATSAPTPRPGAAAPMHAESIVPREGARAASAEAGPGRKIVAGGAASCVAALGVAGVVVLGVRGFRRRRSAVRASRREPVILGPRHRPAMVEASSIDQDRGVACDHWELSCWVAAMVDPPRPERLDGPVLVSIGASVSGRGSLGVRPVLDRGAAWIGVRAAFTDTSNGVAA